MNTQTANKLSLNSLTKRISVMAIMLLSGPFVVGLVKLLKFENSNTSLVTIKRKGRAFAKVSFNLQ